MTQALFSLLEGNNPKYCSVSKSFIQNKYYLLHSRLIISDKLLMCLTIGWIVWKLSIYDVLTLRPQVLFKPSNWFGHLFMPFLPHPLVFQFICVGLILLSLFLLYNQNNRIVRLILFFGLLWINVAQWSWGVFTHVSHIFLLCHMFSIFLPFKKTILFSEQVLIVKMAYLFYAGIFFTYFSSAIWKWIGLFYKIVFKPTEVHWLHPNAALFNAFIGFRNYDMPFNIAHWFDYPIVWQMAFGSTLMIQSLCIFASFRIPLLFWTGAALIFFHYVNAVVFLTSFIVAPVTLACLCFPYLRLDNKEIMSEGNFWREDGVMKYKRVYNNGDTDTYSNFYALREYLYDRNSYFGGLLYIPGVSFLFSEGQRMTIKTRSVFRNVT